MIRRSLVLIAFFATALPRPRPQRWRRPRSPDIAVFDEVWRLVDQRFYDPDFRGQDWGPCATATGRSPRPRRTRRRRPRSSTDMLAELGASHTARYRPERAGLLPAARHLLRLAAPGVARACSPTACAIPASACSPARSATSCSCRAPSPACPPRRPASWSATRSSTSTAQPFEPVGSFDGKVGQTVTMHVRRAAGGAVLPIATKPVWIEPAKAFLDAMSDGARIIESRRQEDRLCPDLVVRRRPLPGDARATAVERQAARMSTR